MQDLRHNGLQELIETALRERLIDACDASGDLVVIEHGKMRVELSHGRAHAFLRGVIEGMSRVRDRRRHLMSSVDTSPPPETPEADVSNDLPESYETLDSFRHFLLNKWWSRYEAAGCPFGRARHGLMLWIQYGSATTRN